MYKYPFDEPELDLVELFTSDRTMWDEPTEWDKECDDDTQD